MQRISAAVDGSVMVHVLTLLCSGTQTHGGQRPDCRVQGARSRRPAELTTWLAALGG